VANATVTVRISGGGLSAGDTLDVFGTTFQIKNVSADGNSAEADVKLPGDFSPTKTYLATVSSPRTAEKTAPVNLVSTDGLKLTSVNFADSKQAAPNSVVTLKIVGSSLTTGDTVLSGFGTTVGLKNVGSDATSAEATITLPGNYDAAKQYSMVLNSSRTGEKTTPVNLPSPKGLTLTAINFADRTKAVSNAQVTLTLVGTNLTGDTVLNIFGSTVQLKNGNSDGTSAEAGIQLPKDYDPTNGYDATVSSANTGEKTGSVKLPSAR
jgi:hypothetical protein